MSATDERVLVARARSGDRSAFEELVRLHADQLHGVVERLCASQHEAEEATQEAFLRAWRAIGRFDGRSRFFTWLYRIGVNEAMRGAGSAARRLQAVSLEESPVEPPEPCDGPEARALRRELHADLESSLRALPVEHRAPLVLRDVEGLSTAESAQILGISEAAFKSRLHRARLAVRHAVEEYLDTDEKP